MGFSVAKIPHQTFIPWSKHSRRPEFFPGRFFWHPERLGNPVDWLSILRVLGRVKYTHGIDAKSVSG